MAHDCNGNPKVHMLVATLTGDLTADVISAAVARDAGMVLVADRVVTTAEAEAMLARFEPQADCVIILVGPASGTAAVAARWLRRRERLVVVRVGIAAGTVQIAARDVGLDALLAALRRLVQRAAAFAGVAVGVRH